MTASTRTETPWPGAVILNGWHFTVRALRELVATVDDPWQLSDAERLSLLAMVPGYPESVVLARFIAWAEAERDLDKIDPDDYSAEAAIRREELGNDCSRLAAELLDRHPFAPAWPIGDAHTPDPVYAADLYQRLREDVRERDERLVRLIARVADLEAANLSLEQLVDVQRHGATYALTDAGVAATDATGNVVALPVGGAR